MALRMGSDAWREIIDGCIAEAKRRDEFRIATDPEYREKQKRLIEEYQRIFAEPKCEG